MLFKPLEIPEVVLIELEKKQDERGFFSRMFCSDMFVERGLCADYPQWNVSFNDRRDTLRGLHFQVRPHEEIKLVSCTRGAIFDVAVDVRAGSPSYGKWVGIELSADSRSSVYIPAGFAHGYQTLTDDAEVRYCVSARYHPEAERGVRWGRPGSCHRVAEGQPARDLQARSGSAKIAGLITRSDCGSVHFGWESKLRWGQSGHRPTNGHQECKGK